MISNGCIHDCSDDDCYMCSIHGYIWRCPKDCKDYEDMFGNKGRA